MVHAEGLEIPAVSGEAACIHGKLRKFILEDAHPCVGASAALRKDEYWMGVYPAMAEATTTPKLARDLFKYIEEQEKNPREFATFLAVFKTPKEMSEEDFEKSLWEQLSQLDRVSSAFFEWDSKVESDPESAKFSFSFAGRAFYVVGLHQGSSRMARSFEYPTLVI